MTGPHGLIALRDTLDARVYLGCVTDAAARVQKWVEIWVQDPANALLAPTLARDSLSNAALDRRWIEAYTQLQSIEDEVVATGWETEPPRPIWIDPASSRPIHPIDPQANKPWVLCRDETALAEAGLPPYSTSSHRYLYVPERGDQSQFVAITPDAPANERTAPQEVLFAGRGDLLPLNRGGLMMVRALGVLTLEEFSDLLSAKPSASRSQGTPKELLPQTSAPSNGTEESGWLFLGRHGKWGRVVETFHLKLRALSDAVSATRAAIAKMQRPMLNLDADQFKVRLGDFEGALPWLWTSRIQLADSGDAVHLPIAGSESHYYTLARPPQAPIYHPPAHELSRGRGSVRVRKVLADLADGAVVEGTLASQEPIIAAKNDLVWLRLTLPDGPLDLYARVDPNQTLAAGEWRFRTIGQRLAPARLGQLSEGFSATATFEVLPVLSSPCDLFSLGVIAVRMLLVNAQAALPVALDETLSLAREVANQHDAQSPLPLRIRSILESDPKWIAALGPHRLMWEGLSPQQAIEIVPLDLWTDVLAMIVAMFPGIGSDSAAGDLGDAPHGALQRVFERTSSELDKLLLRTRSLIVIDWRYNREIHAVIRGYMTGLSGASATAAPAAGAKVAAKH
jgi:hypothetical protein